MGLSHRSLHASLASVERKYVLQADCAPTIDPDARSIITKMTQRATATADVAWLSTRAMPCCLLDAFIPDAKELCADGVTTGSQLKPLGLLDKASLPASNHECKTRCWSLLLAPKPNTVGPRCNI